MSMRIPVSMTWIILTWIRIVNTFSQKETTEGDTSQSRFHGTATWQQGQDLFMNVPVAIELNIWPYL